MSELRTDNIISEDKSDDKTNDDNSEININADDFSVLLHHFLNSMEPINDKKELIVCLEAKRHNKHFIVVKLHNLYQNMHSRLHALMQMEYKFETNNNSDSVWMNTIFSGHDIAVQTNQNDKCCLIMLKIPILLENYKLRIKVALYLIGYSRELITNEWMDFSDEISIDIDCSYQNKFNEKDKVYFYPDRDILDGYLSGYIHTINKSKINPDNYMLNTYDIIFFMDKKNDTTNDDSESKEDGFDVKLFRNIPRKDIQPCMIPINNFISLCYNETRQAMIGMVSNIKCTSSVCDTYDALYQVSLTWLNSLIDNSTAKEYNAVSNVFISNILIMLYEQENAKQYTCINNCNDKLILSQNQHYGMKKYKADPESNNIQYGCDICGYWLNNFEYMYHCPNHDICLLCIFDQYRYYKPLKELLYELLYKKDLMDEDTISVLLSYIIGYTNENHSLSK